MRAKSKNRPRTKPAEERRDEILNAALALFLKQGVEPTTIEEITAGADVAKGTFYLYFSSKENLRAALGDRFAKELLAGIKNAVAERPEKDWKGILAAWARADVTGYLDSVAVHDIAFFGAHPSPRKAYVKNIVIDHLFELLEAGKGAGAWLLDDPHLAAVFLFSGLHGIVDEAIAREKRVNRTRLLKSAEEFCFRTVGLPTN